MTNSNDLADLIHASALEWVPRGGGIGEVERDGDSVLIYGRRPGLLRPFTQQQTCVEAIVTGADVRAIVLGGRPGIPHNVELFSLPVADRPASELADDVVARISNYLAATTS